MFNSAHIRLFFTKVFPLKLPNSFLWTKLSKETYQAFQIFHQDPLGAFFSALLETWGCINQTLKLGFQWQYLAHSDVEKLVLGLAVAAFCIFCSLLLLAAIIASIYFFIEDFFYLALGGHGMRNYVLKKLLWLGACYSVSCFFDLSVGRYPFRCSLVLHSLGSSGLLRLSCRCTLRSGDWQPSFDWCWIVLWRGGWRAELSLCTVPPSPSFIAITCRVPTSLCIQIPK